MRGLFLFCALQGVSAFQFLSIGDWGDTEAKRNAPEMGKFSPEFVLALGDNFYDDGVKSVDDPQFKNKFEDTFTAPSLQVPWYVCAGNHDYYGGSKGIEAEIQYSKRSPRWNFPDFYYAKELTTKDGTTILVVSIDTWRLNGGDTYVAFDLSTGRLALRNETRVRQDFAAGKIERAAHDVLLRQFVEAPADQPLTNRGDHTQLKWIQTTLQDSKADWKIVIGHFPVHSATTGEHGDTQSLIEDLQPIMQNAGVDLYLNGHDHVLQHIQLNGVNYFGSGAGARHHSSMNANYKGLMGYAAGNYGFMVHEGSATALTTTFVQPGGTEPYTYTIRKPRKGFVQKMVERVFRL